MPLLTGLLNLSKFSKSLNIQVYRHQNIFQNIALKVYKTAFKFGSEDLVIKILVKGNMASQLLIAYNDVIQNNNQCHKILHAENFMICVREFVKEINLLQKVHSITNISLSSLDSR